MEHVLQQLKRLFYEDNLSSVVSTIKFEHGKVLVERKERIFLIPVLYAHEEGNDSNEVQPDGHGAALACTRVRSTCGPTQSDKLDSE
jgi:hypothetical protein